MESLMGNFWGGNVTDGAGVVGVDVFASEAKGTGVGISDDTEAMPV